MPCCIVLGYAQFRVDPTNGLLEPTTQIPSFSCYFKPYTQLSQPAKMELSTWCIATFCVFIHPLIKQRAEGHVTHRLSTLFVFVFVIEIDTRCLASDKSGHVHHPYCTHSQKKKYAWTNVCSVSNARAKKTNTTIHFWLAHLFPPFVGANQPCTIRHDVIVFVFFHKKGDETVGWLGAQAHCRVIPPHIHSFFLFLFSTTTTPFPLLKIQHDQQKTWCSEYAESEEGYCGIDERKRERGKEKVEVIRRRSSECWSKCSNPVLCFVKNQARSCRCFLLR